MSNKESNIEKGCEGESSDTDTDSSSTHDPAYYWIDDDGYAFVGDDEKITRVHALVAIADGADPYRVFGDQDVHVHHSVHRRLNTPEYVEVLDRTEHLRRHREWEYARTDDGVPRLRPPLDEAAATSDDGPTADVDSEDGDSSSTEVA